MDELSGDEASQGKLQWACVKGLASSQLLLYKVESLGSVVV